MRVAVFGATGVLGRPTLPTLVEAGHEVRGLARHVDPGRPELTGMDLLDRDAVIGFAEKWRPEALVHLATAIPTKINPRKIREQFALTNRLRTEGTRNLLAAANACGARRIVAQSIAFAYRPGAGLANEDEPLWTDADNGFAELAETIAELERLTVGAGGIALRFGQLYGPGTAFDADGAIGSGAAKGMLPIIHRGGRESTFSLLHTADAASAVAAALATDVSGCVNVVDDDPAVTSEWLPVLAAARGGRRPRRLPAWLLRPLLGPYGIAFMTELRGATNERAKRELGWQPSIPSWRRGLLTSQATGSGP